MAMVTKESLGTWGLDSPFMKQPRSFTYTVRSPRTEGQPMRGPFGFDPIYKGIV